MQSMKKMFLILIPLLCAALTAHAGSAPTSQFGFKGWPYRQSAPCAQITAQPTRTVRPVATPRPTPAVQPTQRPAATDSVSSPADVGDYTTLSVSAQEYSAWNLLNDDRAAAGLPALPLDEKLCAIARIKSMDMKENRYFAHESPTYGKAADMLKTFGYSFRGVAENIAHHATVEKAQAAFMSSTGHRASILGSQWTRVGVGVWTDDQGFVYVTQLFAR